MNYNFYTLLIASIVIGSPIIFLKNDMLKIFSITEEIILVSLGILSILSSFYFGYEKKSFKNLTRNLDRDIIYKFILYVFLITTTLLIGNYIVKSEGKVIRYKSFQRALSLILMLMIGHYIFGERVTQNTCLGVGIIILGLFILDR
tara:strand:- start:1543 stop:1980 length:438 start_codon:yes stop_codon:yes gene_type:complete